MSPETSMGGPAKGFSPTLWSLVLRARDHSREALGEISSLYWKPVYFFIRRWGYGVDDAKDLCQDFFAELLGRDVLQGVAPERGRFRTFLLTVLKRHLINHAEKARALKRGGGRSPLPLDFGTLESIYAALGSERLSPERAFERQWAADTLQRALAALKDETDPSVFEALQPHLAGEGPSYGETARTLGWPITRMNNVLHRLRTRYRDLLRQHVAAGLDDPRGVDDELNELFRALKD